MQRIKSIVSLVAMMTFLFASHGQTGAMVLCLEMDGKVVLEAAVGGNCVSETDPHVANPRDSESLCTAQHDQEHCERCIDIPIALVDFDECHTFVKVKKTKLKVPFAETIPITVNRGEPSHSLLQSRSFPDVNPTTISCIRTVSLLI